MDTVTQDAGDGGGASSVSSAGKRDRWLLWPALATFATAFCIVLLCGIPGVVSFILIPLVMLGWPLATIALLIPAGVFAKRKCYRKAASVTMAVLLPILFWKPVAWMADCAHIALTVSLDSGQIGSVSTSRDSHLEAYDWSVGLAGGPNTFMIYDPTDEIALPPSQHRHPLSDENGFGEDCAGKVDHIIGHYYRCVFE